LSSLEPTELSLEHAELQRRWFPICARHDLPARHVFEAELLGRELAVWRGLGGNVNVWENRCPHRGMRLTVGANLGGELRCAYHGYRFADGTGLCQSVPAQPHSAPPRSLRTKVYPMLESCGLIWTRLQEDPGAEPPPSIGGASVPLYSVAVRATMAAVGALLAGYDFRPSATLLDAATADERCATVAMDAYSVSSVASKHHQTTEVRLFMQPVDAHCTVVHGVLLGDLAEAERLPTLRHHAQQLSRLRDAGERRVRAPAGGAAARGG
jgi:nitrite reductase/ring-hydroxylating ferredoxin subunit